MRVQLPSAPRVEALVVLLVALVGALACGYVDVCVCVSNEGFVTLHEHRPLADPREAQSRAKPSSG